VHQLGWGPLGLGEKLWSQLVAFGFQQLVPQLEALLQQWKVMQVK
jgi:hypothetical protein